VKRANGKAVTRPQSCESWLILSILLDRIFKIIKIGT